MANLLNEFQVSYLEHLNQEGKRYDKTRSKLEGKILDEFTD